MDRRGYTEIFMGQNWAKKTIRKKLDPSEIVHMPKDSDVAHKV